MYVGHQQLVGLYGILSKQEKSDHKCKEIQIFQDKILCESQKRWLVVKEGAHDLRSDRFGMQPQL